MPRADASSWTRSLETVSLSYVAIHATLSGKATRNVFKAELMTDQGKVTDNRYITCDLVVAQTAGKDVTPACRTRGGKGERILGLPHFIFASQGCTTGATLCGFSERRSLDAWLGGKLINETPQ